jgi:hypothetical protein
MKYLVLTVLLVTLCLSSAAAGSLLVVVASDGGSQVAATLRQRADFLAVPVSLISNKGEPSERFAALGEAKTALNAAIAKRSGWLTLDGPLLLSGQSRSKFASSYGDQSQTHITLLIPITDKADIYALATDATRFIVQQTLPGKIETTIGNIELAVKDPQQYRPALLKLIAEEIARTRSLVAPGGKISIHGLEGPVLVRQSSDREVELSINYQLFIEKQ